MKALLISGVVLLCFFLLGQIRVGVRALYQDAGPTVWLRLGAIRKQVFPAPPKKEQPKPKPDKPKKEKPEQPAKSLQEKIGGAVDYARELLPLVLEAASYFKRKLQVDTLRLVLTAGSSDPADTAMLYGQSMAVLGAFWYPLTEAFHVKDGTAKVDLDFNAGSMTVFADVTMSLKLGQILWLVLCFGLKGPRSFVSVRSKQKKHVRKAA